MSPNAYVVSPNSGSLRATACTLGLSEAEFVAEAESVGQDVTVAGIAHQNLIVDSLEYEG